VGRALEARDAVLRGHRLGEVKALEAGASHLLEGLDCAFRADPVTDSDNIRSVIPI
jgi:hypothetical protein